MPNGYSKVTWVEHAEYEESQVHQLYCPLLSSGMAFGAQRWVATLQCQCECLAILMSSTVPTRDHTGITAGGRRNMLKLAQRITDNFYAGVCVSSVHKWNKLNVGHVDEDVRVMTRKSVDILSNGGPMQEMSHIAKGQDHGNCVSLLLASAMNSNQSSMLILQETCIDAAGLLVVSAPVDIPAMHVAMNGGDSTYVALLPSGFAIVPDGPPGSRGGPTSMGGSLLSVAFQILVNSLPTAKVTVESVETVNNLISCTVQKIKAAFQCES
ncbi:Homeobox-leucine zipper protein ROC6 [Hibiscus syriacus]|uniref:Homeobox-leucine zipper protein ROC6 n=1 Tax=Hibiscus syriacus TaxID=106335 RepID=A0A6A3CY72_HIBSY|nr:Homeobox-leucine zipper protein ROC6 [Hibiscus syriacus]